MKTRFFPKTACVLAAMAAVSFARAADFYWDADGNASSAIGGTGNWSGTLWRSGSPTGPLSAWTNASSNNAILAGNSGVLTIDSGLASGVITGTLTVNTDGYSIVSTANGRPLTATAIVTASGVGLTFNMNSTGAIWTSGSISLGSSSTLTLSGSATGSNANRINLTANATVAGGSIVLNGGGAGVTGFVSTGTGVSFSTPITNNSPTSATMIGATSGNDLTLNSTAIIAGSAGVQFSAGPSGGAGTITINSSNTYSGATVFNNSLSGTVRLGVNNALPSTTTLFFGATQNAGVFDLNGHDQQIGALSSGSGGSLTGTITNNFVGTGTNTLTINGAASPPAFAGVISDGANGSKTALVLASANTGTTTLNGQNTYTGGTFLNGGKLALGVGNILADTGAVSIGGGTLDLQSHSETVGAVTITSGTIASTGGAGTLTGSGALTKNNATAATIASNASYSGGAILTSGTLFVNGSIAGSTTINNGATLAGSGTVAAVLAQSGGILSPGNNGIGTLTTGSLSLNAGAHLSMQLNGTSAGTLYDQIRAGGAVNLNADGSSKAILDLSLGYAPAPGDLFFLLVNNGGGGIGDTFAGLGEGAVFNLPSSANGQSYAFAITYLANSSANSFTGGNDIALMVVPEPQTWAILLAGFGVLILLRRFRRVHG